MKITPTVAFIAVCAVGLAAAAGAQEMDCGICHDEVTANMTHQIHMRIEPFEVQGRAVGCEGCHGDGEAHMEEGDPALIRTFDEAGDGAACVDCHADIHHPGWEASTHAMEQLECTSCHTVHSETNPLDTCRDCHADTYAQFELPSHHPVREGRMSCVSCHDVHAATEYQLDTHQRKNDLCYTCHQAKEGPFIFEHEPVVEDCALCHQPHGAVADNLLTANEPMLCLQCHEIHFHAGLISPPGETEIGGQHFENPFGEYSMNRSFTTNCSHCHSSIHGTDVPSQSLAGRGRGMVR